MLSRLQDKLNKPYYLFRPRQLFIRLKRRLSGYKPINDSEQVVLPWKMPIRVRPSDMIGSAIIRAGVYDPCVSEVLWRLLDKEETAIDAGANIGQMTSLMARRVGEKGKVLSFEPHPHIFQELSANVALWQTFPNVGKICIYELGLSNEAGSATLHTTAEFASNRGTASLEANQEPETEQEVAHSVSIVRLEDIVGKDLRIGVMKIDVEGHEMSLLQGAFPLLSEHRIRDIIFEDHHYYPSPVTDYLEKSGYTIFNLRQGPLSVRVCPASPDEVHYKYEAQSYLATLEVSRALKRLSKFGYQSLRSH